MRAMASISTSRSPTATSRAARRDPCARARARRTPQFLDAYKRLRTWRRSAASASSLDKELARFSAAAGRLNAKVDKVGGMVETNRPDQKTDNGIVKQAHLSLPILYNPHVNGLRRAGRWRAAAAPRIARVSGARDALAARLQRLDLRMKSMVSIKERRNDKDARARARTPRAIHSRSALTRPRRRGRASDPQASPLRRLRSTCSSGPRAAVVDASRPLRSTRAATAAAAIRRRADRAPRAPVRAGTRLAPHARHATSSSRGGPRMSRDLEQHAAGVSRSRSNSIALGVITGLRLRALQRCLTHCDIKPRARCLVSASPGHPRDFGSAVPRGDQETTAART